MPVMDKVGKDTIENLAHNTVDLLQQSDNAGGKEPRFNKRRMLWEYALVSERL